MKKTLLLSLTALLLSTPSLAQTQKAPASSAAPKSGKAKSKPKQKQQQQLVDEIYVKVAEITADKLGVLPDKVSPSAKLVDDLGADDLDLVELIMAIEDEFQLEISDKDAESMKTVGDLAIYVRIHQ